MSTREERQKQLLGDGMSTREIRGRNLLSSELEAPQTRSDVVSRLLESRRARIAETPKPAFQKRETPTYVQMRQGAIERAQTRAGTLPEIPKVTFGLPDKQISSTVLSFNEPQLQQAKRDLVGTVLFGTGSDKPLGKSSDGIVDYAKEKGVIGFLYGTTLKSKDERTAERYEKLVGQGIEPERAYQIAEAWAGSGVVPTDLSDKERKSMRNFTIFENTFIALELADLLLVGKPVNTALKGLTRGTQRQLFADVAKAVDATEARNIILAKYPTLAGTEGLDELISLARQASENDSWSKIISDTKTGKELLNQKQSTARVTSTEAQRVFYENGIPIVRGGEVPATTVMRGGKEVPSVTADAMALRTEIRNVLAGESEAMRLSNLDVLADEIKAGALPFKATPDTPVRMFVDDAATTLRAGDRLATSKEVMKELVEGGKVRMMEVMPDDLVRLADGTFTYAPKKEIGKGVQGTLRALRGSQRTKVASIEKAQEFTTLRKQLARETDKFDQEVARQERQAAAKAKRAERLAQAKAVLRDKEAVSKKLIDETVSTREARISEVRANAKAANSAVREAQKTLRTLVTNIGKTSKRVAKERDKARRAIERVRGLKTVDAKEKAKRITKIRKDRDRAIARIEKEKKQMAKQADKARAKLADAKAKQIDVTAEVSKIRNEAKLRVNMIKADTKAELAVAKQVVGEAEQVRQKVRVEKAKVRNKETSTRLADTLKENFNVTAMSLKDAGETTTVTNKLEKISDVASNSLKNSDNGMREKSLNFLRENPTEITKGEVRLREIEDGGIVIEDGRHRLAVGTELGITPNIVDVTAEYTGKQSAKIAALLGDAVPTSVTSPITPVKGEGKTVANQIIQGFQDELEVIKRTYEERGLSLADLPDTHKAIGNPELLKKAFADLIADPYKVYNDFISGVFPDGTTRAAYGLALMKSDFVLTNPTRMDMIARTFMKGNTRIGQELQSIKVFGKMDYINIVGRFTKQADELLTARGVNVEQEAAKLTKLFGDELENIATVAKSDVLKAVDAITCKVE